MNSDQGHDDYRTKVFSIMVFAFTIMMHEILGAIMQAVLRGKVDLLEEHTFIVDSRGETKLLAEAGTAVIVVNQAGRCYYQTVPL